jgi:hypothetical protein
MERYTLIFSFHLDYAQHHSFSISSARDYIGSQTGYLAEILFIIWMTSYLSMIQIQSSSVLSHHTLVSQRMSKNGKTDGLSISLASNLTQISWRLNCQRTNMIVPSKGYKDCSPPAQLHIVPSKTSLVSSHFVRQLSPWDDLLFVIFSISSNVSHLHPHAIRHLSMAAKCDLLWWMALLPQWSGIFIINPARPQVIIHTDASGVKGIGGWWDTNHAFSTCLARQH